jgi:ergothioneine biosynthesis protein EgtB
VSPTASAPARTTLERFREVRAASERLAAPLSTEDCGVQSMEDASPTKWHLAHTSWYFETFVLEAAVPGYTPFDPHFRVLFNSYYNGIGDQFARPQRGLLSRPSLEQVREYRAHVDAHMQQAISDALTAELDAIAEIGLHHEQQHQELIVTDLKHALSRNPMHPAYRACAESEGHEAPPLGYQAFDEELHWIGHEGKGFAFDNEGPAHRVYVEAFELASRPTTNGEFIAFIEAGGYREPTHWLADGWAAVQQRGWAAPLYWERRDDAWHVQTLGGLQPLDLGEPVCHVSFYEADAYARFAGGRLPSEAEWEVAGRQQPVAGHFVESERFHPRGAPDAAGVVQLYGDVWEWTRSPYVPYPGFTPPAGALGEYNGKFMSNQLVLRGGSCATPESHIRPTYRNFFYPDARWQFSGIRLARDRH